MELLSINSGFYIIGICVTIFLLLCLYISKTISLTKHNKYIFKKPNGEIDGSTFTIWHGQEGVLLAHELAKRYSDKYPYFKIAIVDSTMSLEEIQNSTDIVWKTRSEMFYNGR